jgi:phosphoglucomutase
LGENGPAVSLMVGGDGRYFGTEAVARIIKMSAANPKIRKLIVAQNGLMSTPAVSCCIRKYKTFAGIILTASHNPGGPNADFGVKFNCANGGPALQNLTDKVFEISTKISEYFICENVNVDISRLGSTDFKIDNRDFTVEVIDSVQDYLDLMKQIFNFEALRNFCKSHRITANALSGG